MQTDAVLSEWVFCLTIAGSHVIGFEKLMFNTACDFVCFFFSVVIIRKRHVLYQDHN